MEIKGLVRVAMVKFPSLEAHSALEKLVNENVFPHALEPSTSDIREKLLDDGVQKIYQLFRLILFPNSYHAIACCGLCDVV
jgi:hypothetical protein